MKSLILSAFAAAVLFAAVPTQAKAQQEDVGIVMQQLAQATGCNPCYQSCVVTQALIQFDYNVPAMLAWFGGVTASYNVWMQLMDDDLWFFADWPLVSNQPVPISPTPHNAPIAAPRLPVLTKELYYPEFAVPLARFR